MSGPARRRLGVAALLVAATVLAPTAASAHTEVVDVEPSSGARLDAPPKQVELTFASPILDQGYALVVTDGRGTRHRLASTAGGSTLSGPWDPDIAPGRVTLAYRVVARDGHPIVGSATWTLAAATGASRSAAPRSTSTAAASAAAVADPVAADAPAQSGARRAGLLAAFGLLVVIGAAVLWRRRAANRP